jgi:hypothetical protein
LGEAYFSTKDDGTSCLPCLDSCPTLSLKRLRTATVYLAILLGAAVLVFLAIIDSIKDHRKVFANEHNAARSQLRQDAQQLASNQSLIENLKSDLKKFKDRQTAGGSLQGSIEPLREFVQLIELFRD